MTALLTWIPRSTFGAVLTVLYLVLAVTAVMIDRKDSGGGWITLHGMASFIITIPVSLLGEWLGMKPDYRRNADMAFAIGLCAVLVYFIGAALSKLARLAFPSGGPA